MIIRQNWFFNLFYSRNKDIKHVFSLNLQIKTCATFKGDYWLLGNRLIYINFTIYKIYKVVYKCKTQHIYKINLSQYITTNSNFNRTWDRDGTGEVGGHVTQMLKDRKLLWKLITLNCLYFSTEQKFKKKLNCLIYEI